MDPKPRVILVFGSFGFEGPERLLYYFIDLFQPGSVRCGSEED